MTAYGIWIYPSGEEPSLHFDSEEEAKIYAGNCLKGYEYTIDEINRVEK